MKITALALVALFGVLGVTLGMGYGGYQYVPVHPGAGGAGYNDNTFCKSFFFLFLFFTRETRLRKGKKLLEFV
jgi:hypothetical protein